MSSLLNLGTRALLANQIALSTTGHNISNASTVGYSRQTAVMQQVEGQFTGGGYIGKGVQVGTIERAHNEFLTRQAALARSVQAMDSPDRAGNLEWAIRFCLDHPQWQLSLQTHKLTGIR